MAKGLGKMGEERRGARVALVAAALGAGLLVAGLLGGGFDEPEGREPPTTEQVGGGEPNSDYERCIADDECLRDLMEFTERDR